MPAVPTPLLLVRDSTAVEESEPDELLNLAVYWLRGSRVKSLYVRKPSPERNVKVTVICAEETIPSTVAAGVPGRAKQIESEVTEIATGTDKLVLA